MELTPQQIGPYLIHEEIGRGRQVVVFRGHDTLYDRPVALKVLPPYAHHAPNQVRAFITSGREAARLRHPHIAEVYDTGQSDGYIYTVQALAPGGTLAQHLATHSAPHSIDEAFAMLGGLAAALDYIHSQGLVHGALHPGNILLASDNHVLLTNIFRSTQPDPKASLLANPGDWLTGEIAYLAPEQARGRSTIDQRADLFSLGVLAYRLLTGVRPFQADNILALLHAIIDEMPTPASKRHDALMPAVDEVLTRGLAKAAEDRFVSAGSFVRALAAPYGIVPLPLLTTREDLRSNDTAISAVSLEAEEIAPAITQTLDADKADALSRSLKPPAILPRDSGRQKAAPPMGQLPSGRRLARSEMRVLVVAGTLVGLALLALLLAALLRPTSLRQMFAGGTREDSTVVREGDGAGVDIPAEPDTPADIAMSTTVSAPHLTSTKLAMVAPTVAPSATIRALVVLTPTSPPATDTATSVPTPLPLATDTSAPTPTSTPLATDTPLPAPLPTATPVPTDTPASTATPATENLAVDGSFPATANGAGAASAPASLADSNQSSAAKDDDIPAEPLSISGAIAYAVWNPLTSRMDTYIYQIDLGVSWPKLENTRQPDFRYNGELIVNAEGGKVNNLVRELVTGENAFILSDHPEDSRPHWSPSGKKVVYDSTLVGDGKHRIYLHEDVKVRMKVDPMRFEAWELFGRNPVFLTDDLIAFNGCDGWANASNCGIQTVNTTGGLPATITGHPNDLPTDNLGARILFMSPRAKVDRADNWDVYIVNADGSGLQRLTTHPAHDGLPTASPDGNHIAFVTDRDGVWAVYVMRRDGSGQRKLFDIPGDYAGGAQNWELDWRQERISWGW